MVVQAAAQLVDIQLVLELQAKEITVVQAVVHQMHFLPAAVVVQAQLEVMLLEVLTLDQEVLVVLE
jgi:hypothetical protein